MIAYKRHAYFRLQEQLDYFDIPAGHILDFVDIKPIKALLQSLYHGATRRSVAFVNEARQFVGVNEAVVVQIVAIDLIGIGKGFGAAFNPKDAADTTVEKRVLIGSGHLS